MSLSEIGFKYVEAVSNQVAHALAKEVMVNVLLTRFG